MRTISTPRSVSLMFINKINNFNISTSRMRLALNISEAIYLDVDIHESIAEFNVSKPIHPLSLFVPKSIL